MSNQLGSVTISMGYEDLSANGLQDPRWETCVSAGSIHAPLRNPLDDCLPYGTEYHMKAEFIYREKYIYEDGAIREMVLWQLPRGTAGKLHALKYRLYYGLPDGTCVVRYDNEAGKGDHRHFGGKEESYSFKGVETLVANSLDDIERVRRGKK